MGAFFKTEADYSAFFANIPLHIRGVFADESF